MATSYEETNINVQLFKELTEKYPEVPKEVVSGHLRMTGNNKDQCIKLLKSQSPQYLYGPNVAQGIVTNELKNLTITKQTSECTRGMLINQQSDSGTSIHSVSLPHTIETIVRPTPAPKTATVLPTDFEPFVEAANNKQGNIPNINCTVHKSDSSPSVSQTVKKFEVNSCGPSNTSPMIGKRPVPVIHCPPSTVETGQVASKNTSYQIHTSGGSGGTCTVVDPLHSQTSSYNFNMSKDVVNTVSNSSPIQYAHSSQARIMINQPNNGHQNTSSMNTRTNQYETSGNMQNVFVQPSMTGGNVNAFPVPGNHTSPSNTTTNYTKPIFVKIKTSCPASLEEHVRYNINYPSNFTDNQSPSHASQTRLRHSPHPTGGPRLQIASINQSNVSPNSNRTTYVPYPQYPVSSGLNAHVTSNSRTSSVDSEHGSVFLGQEGEISHPVIYPMSPASSHSSLSSESSVHLQNTRPASGNMQEDQEYVIALLYHQRLRLDNLKRDYNDTHKETEKLRQEVAQMEKNMLETSARRNSFPTVEDVTKLRELNRRLQTDIQCMGNEVDMKKNGQGPFSIVDPIEQQNFFANMPTGPSGPIGRPAKPAPPPPVPPPLNLNPPPPHSPLDIVPPVPPRQPSTGSGDSEEGEQWNCSACTLLNHPALNKCECCEMPRILIGPS